MHLLEALGPDADPGTHARALCYRIRNRLGLGQGLDADDVERVLAYESLLPPERLAVERVSYRFGIWFRHVDELDESRARLEHDLHAAVDASDEFLQIALLAHLGLTHCCAGELLLARERADAAAALADDLGVRPADLLGARALVAAHLGDVEQTRSLAAEAIGDGDNQRLREPGPIYANGALGLLELSLADERAAAEHFRAALLGFEAAGLREPGIYRVHANAAEAALGAGERDIARAIADGLLDHGERTGHRWSRATGWRVRALTAAADGSLEVAREAAERALSLHDDLGMPFERARTALAAGIIERRARQRRKAQALLAEACAEFERMGARLWAMRARHELERVGIRRAPEAQLTPGERSVAELAASGLKNREIAATLFVSPKTVEANLARAYRKLGVRSRSELAARWSTLQT
jgi:DNA-binding NarL/FixJ family response regulator